MTVEILSYIGISLIGWLGLLLSMTGDDPNVRIRGGARVPRNNINDAERVPIPKKERVDNGQKLYSKNHGGSA